LSASSSGVSPVTVILNNAHRHKLELSWDIMKRAVVIYHLTGEHDKAVKLFRYRKTTSRYIPGDEAMYNLAVLSCDNLSDGSREEYLAELIVELLKEKQAPSPEVFDTAIQILAQHKEYGLLIHMYTIMKEREIRYSYFYKYKFSIYFDLQYEIIFICFFLVCSRFALDVYRCSPSSYSIIARISTGSLKEEVQRDMVKGSKGGKVVYSNSNNNSNNNSNSNSKGVSTSSSTSTTSKSGNSSKTTSNTNSSK
jgi:hypothetical protein